MSRAPAVAPVAAAPPTTLRGFTVAFEPARARVAGMRRITEAHLRLWAIHGPLAENIVLVLSELVTMAVEHGHGAVSLFVGYAEDKLRIEVTDGNPTPAQRRACDDSDVSGRGMLIVTVLAQEWGVTQDGKTTWASFHIPAGRS